MSSWEKLKLMNPTNEKNGSMLLVLSHMIPNALLYVSVNSQTSIDYVDQVHGPNNKTKLAIWKYNIRQNDWIKLIEIHSDDSDSGSLHTSSLDSENMILYRFGARGHMIQIDLNTKKINTSKQSNTDYQDPLYLKSLFIDNELHIFSRWKPDKWTHHIWDNKSRKLNLKFKFSASSFNRYSDAEIMYLSSQKTILIWPKNSDTLYYYSLIDGNLIRKRINIISQDHDQGIVRYSRLSTDEKYIMFFEDYAVNIMELATMRVHRWNSDVSISSTVCIKDDDVAKDLAMNGYIRKCWRSLEFKTMRYPPVYLIEIMKKYVNFEMIYNLDNHSNGMNAFWRIKVDDILSNMKLKSGTDKSQDPNYFIIKDALLTYNGQYVIIKKVDKLKNVCSISLPSAPLEIYKTGVPLESIIHSVSALDMSNAQIKVVKGKLVGETASLIGIDNTEAVVQLTSTTEVTIIDKRLIVICVE